MNKEERRKAIIEEVGCRLENMEASAILLGSPGEEYMYADAIVGVIGKPRPAVVYLAGKVVEALMEMNDWDHEEAMEWYGYNTERGVQYIPEKDNPPILVEGIDV